MDRRCRRTVRCRTGARSGRPMALLDAPTHPDAWTIAETDTERSVSGQDHGLTREDVAAGYAPWVGPDGLVPHAVVVRVTQRMWGYGWICRFFHLVLEDAARAVSGSVRDRYTLGDAIDITGLFNRTWQGCP